VTDAKDEIAENLRLSFLEQLRTGDELDRTEVMGRAARLGCNLTRGAVALCGLGLGLGLKAYRIILPRLRREIGRGTAI
jgi:hypothetical protein